MVIKRVGPMSIAKLYAVMCAIIGFIVLMILY